MKNLIQMFDSILYYKVSFIYLGFSGGCSIKWFINDFIPDRMTHIYHLNEN
jgi:hypothetical protein